MSKQYSQTEMLGPGTKNMYAPELTDMPSMQRSLVPYAAARNPYVPSNVTHKPQQKMSHYLNTTSTGEFMPMHRWNTCPTVPDTSS
eukprot:12626359-Ditylum_brightwellii.AAC.1